MRWYVHGDSAVNRRRYEQLRHNIRSSGWSWNGGSRLTQADEWSKNVGIGRSMQTGTPKTPEIGAVSKTLKTSYDKPKPVDLEATDSGLYMRLFREWNQAKRMHPDNVYQNRPRVWWQNFMRSNVRNDSAMFSEQLTFY